MSSTSKKMTKKRCDACNRKMRDGGVQMKIGSDKKINFCPKDWESFIQDLDIAVVAEIFSQDWKRI